MTTQDFNLRIAYWMGAEEVPSERYDRHDHVLQIDYIHIPTAPIGTWAHDIYQHDTARLKYHCDINWQLPVIDRIESLGYDFNIRSESGYYHTEIYRDGATLPHGYYKTRAEAIWQGILTFIDHTAQPGPSNDSNLKRILAEFESMKGQLVITGYSNIERLVAIGDDQEDWYYVTYDGRESLRWSSCVGTVMPLKNQLRDADYQQLINIAKGNHWDLQMAVGVNAWAVRDALLAQHSPTHRFITEIHWDIN